MKLDWPGVSQLKNFDNVLFLNKVFFFFFFFRAKVVVVRVNFQVLSPIVFVQVLTFHVAAN